MMAEYRSIYDGVKGPLDTSADSKRMRGKFYVQQPGRIHERHRRYRLDGQDSAIINNDDRQPASNCQSRSIRSAAYIWKARKVMGYTALALQDRILDNPGHRQATSGGHHTSTSRRVVT